jgi:hypothetical protein
MPKYLVMKWNNVTYKVLTLKILIVYTYALFSTLLGLLTLKTKLKHYFGESIKIYLTSQKA